jgi:O-antigen biosynthesis protein
VNHELVSVVVLSLNGEKVLPRCLDSLLALDWPRHRLEIIVVNNGSSDSTRDIIDRYASESGIVPLHLPQNLGFAGGNNQGIRRARGEWIIMLNDDTEVHADWVLKLMETARAHPKAGILGTLLLYPDGRVQHAGGAVLPDGNTRHLHVFETDGPHIDKELPLECDYVTGAALAFSRAVLNKIGLLDSRYWPIYFEEVDFCWRARKAGFKILQTAARAVHWESQHVGVMSPHFLLTYHRNRHRFVWMNFNYGELREWLKEERKWREEGDGLTVPPETLKQVYDNTKRRVPSWVIRRFLPRR